LPNLKASKKDLVKSRKNRLRNQSTRSAIKTFMKKSRLAIAGAAEPEAVQQAEALVRETSSLVDRAAKRGIIHPNAAARRKSRLAKRLNATQQTETASA
jgi:small subunit ribosomal protein S20